jgi:transcription elongation factor Elf1
VNALEEAVDVYANWIDANAQLNSVDGAVSGAANMSRDRD